MKSIFVSLLLIAHALMPVKAIATSKAKIVIIPVKSSAEEINIKEIRTFSGHNSGVNSVSFSPDGKYALSGSSDKTLKLWVIETGREIRTFSGHNGGVNSVSFSPDGKYALSGSWDKTLKLWDMAGLTKIISIGIERERNKSPLKTKG
ncbi:MAG TPA: hypothetical protein VJ024_00310 [Thermodesulfovibrionales bacterium]|nr:hypothetical protein [Thermodesulfovibrionales bacterium]